MPPYFPRSPQRFARTASEAFRDASYGAAIERPLPSLWKRILLAIARRFE